MPKKWLLLHPKLSWQVVGGSGVGRVRWWCGTGQLIRIELCGSVQILGLDVGEGDEDSPKICALPHNSFLIHCSAILLSHLIFACITLGSMADTQSAKGRERRSRTRAARRER